jgi:hypothetical protein
MVTAAVVVNFVESPFGQTNITVLDVDQTAAADGHDSLFPLTKELDPKCGVGGIAATLR